MKNVTSLQASFFVCVVELYLILFMVDGEFPAVRRWLRHIHWRLSIFPFFFFLPDNLPPPPWNEKKKKKKKTQYFSSHIRVAERDPSDSAESLSRHLWFLWLSGAKKKKKKIWEMISWRRFSLLLLLIGRDVDEERKPEASTSTFYPKRKEKNTGQQQKRRCGAAPFKSDVPPAFNLPHHPTPVVHEILLSFVIMVTRWARKMFKKKKKEKKGKTTYIMR